MPTESSQSRIPVKINIVELDVAAYDGGVMRLPWIVTKAGAFGTDHALYGSSLNRVGKPGL
jgi:hypothetical protein